MGVVILMRRHPEDERDAGPRVAHLMHVRLGTNERGHDSGDTPHKHAWPTTAISPPSQCPGLLGSGHAEKEWWGNQRWGRATGWKKSASSFHDQFSVH